MDMTKLPGHLLEEIYALGERMCAALESEDVDAFCAMVTERGALLDQLNGCPNSVELSGEWDRVAAQLRDQHGALTAAISRQETRLQKTLGSVNRFKDAQRSYAGAEPRGGILHNHVQG